MAEIINNLWMEEPDIDFFSETVMDLRNKISNSIEDIEGIEDFKFNITVRKDSTLEFMVESWVLTQRNDELDMSKLVDGISEVEEIEHRHTKFNGDGSLELFFDYE